MSLPTIGWSGVMDRPRSDAHRATTAPRLPARSDELRRRDAFGGLRVPKPFPLNIFFAQARGGCRILAAPRRG